MPKMRAIWFGQTIHWTSCSDWRAGKAELVKVGSFADESDHHTGSGNLPCVSLVA